MTQEGFKRKLTAILSADVTGYSRLMRDDEEATVRDLAAHRVLITEIIQQHNGRVVDSPGDNILAEFASVVDAVNGAIKIQDEIKKSNTGIAEDRRMEFRIGINLGDVIEEDERIYGDGVNIAARVEGLAAAGGISISGTVYEHIKDKLSLGYHYLGEQNVKNIPEPIRVYRLLTEPEAAGKMTGGEKPKARQWRWAVFGAMVAIILVVGTLAIWNYYLRPPIEPVSVEKMAFPLPDKPSIAVLPFVNMSDDPKQGYFSDGITEDLITDLSAISGLFVIARNSTFAYKGKPVKIQHVFALQDKITQKIVSALAVKLKASEQQQLARKDTDNIAAYDAYLKGWGHYLRYTPEDFAIALSHFKEAIELDSNYGRAYAALARTYWGGSQLGFQTAMEVPWAEARMRAREYLQMAIKNPTSIAHTVTSEMNLTQRLHEEAIAEAKRAIALDPNDADSHATMAKALIFAGRPKEALYFVKRVMRLDPHNIAPSLYLQGLSHFAMGQFDEAVTLMERALKYSPQALGWAAPLAAVYAHLGRDQQARTALSKYEKVLPIKGWFTLHLVMYFWPFKDLQVAGRFADGLLKAGLQGQPSGYYKVSDEHRLSGGEIRDLFFGRTVTSFYRYHEWHKEHLEDRTKDGKVTWRVAPGDYYGQDDSGTSWVEGGMLCNQWQLNMFGIKHCMTVFRNPEGTPEMKNEFLAISDFGFTTFSSVD
jgi:class 3 adenylate cyclase/tetratricopeptide (TPR) repeat protein